MGVATAIRPQAGPPLSGAEILQNARALATRSARRTLPPSMTGCAACPMTSLRKSVRPASCG